MQNPQTSPILRLEQISLQGEFGTDFLLRDISCKIPIGAKVGIIGASGSGKTSLLRVINGLASPSTGEIHLQDISQAQISPVQWRRQVTLVPQEPKLLGMSVMEALAYPLQLQQLPTAEIKLRQETWTNLLHIPSAWFPKTGLQLSLGQRQLIAIARALMIQPKVLLLDEPTSALDLGTATNLLAVLRELNQSQELTIMMANHQLELIKDFCEQLIFLEGGQLVTHVEATPESWQKLSQRILHYQDQQEQEWS